MIIRGGSVGTWNGSVYTAVSGLIANAHTTGSTLGFSSRTLIDPGAPAMDAYRSIMRCTYTMTTVKATGLLPPVSVTLTPFVDFDIKSTLGIRSDAAGKSLSINPFFIDADFRLDGVTTLWES